MKKNRNEFERDYCHLKDYDILKDALPLLLHIRLEIEEDIQIVFENDADLFNFYDGFLRRLEDGFVIEKAPDGYDEAMLASEDPDFGPDLDIDAVVERLDYNLHIYKSLLAPVAENEPVALLYALDSMKNLPRTMFFSRTNAYATTTSTAVAPAKKRGRPVKTMATLVKDLDSRITKEILKEYKFTVHSGSVKLNGVECCSTEHRRGQTASLISYMLYEAKKSPKRKIGFNDFYKTNKIESLKKGKKLPYTTVQLQTASILDDMINYSRKTDGYDKWDGGKLNTSDIINGFKESVIRIVEKDIERRLHFPKGEVPSLLMDAVMTRLIGKNWKIESSDIVFFNISKMIEIDQVVSAKVEEAVNRLSATRN